MNTVKNHAQQYSKQEENRQYIPVRVRRKAVRNKRNLNPLHRSIEAKPQFQILDRNIYISRRKMSRNKKLVEAYDQPFDLIKTKKKVNFIINKMALLGKYFKQFNCKIITIFWNQ